MSNKKVNINDLPFNKRILKAGMAPNLVSAALVFTFEAIFMGMTLRQLPWALLIVAVIVGFAEFVFSPITNGILTTKITAELEAWRANGINDQAERTRVFEAVMSFPLKKAIQTFLYFFICAVLLCLSYRFVPQMGLDWPTAVSAFIACIYGSYFAGLLAYRYSEGICSPIGEKLVRSGIDADYVHKKKEFGMGLTLRAVLYILIPAFYTCCLYIIVIGEGYMTLNGSVPSAVAQIVRIIIVAVIGTGLSIYLTILYFQAAKDPSDSLSDTLTKALTTGSSAEYTKTALGDRVQYNIWLLNNIIARFNNLLAKSTAIGEKVLHATDNLSVASGQLSSTSLEQSASVKEILATMEDSSALSQNIAGTIVNVSQDSERTFQEVTSGFEILQQIMDQNQEINQANISIIEGIRELEKQIENIGNVISIINDIADQTRIIAFNAELESVSAGEEGHNFHIVSTEIRRLANNTLNSISETQKYIENIQVSAQKLISSSNAGTACIQEEMELTGELENRYSEIKAKADATATKSAEISEIIKQQTTSFGQIVITLRQISASIDGFTTMTRTLNDTAIQMQKVASNLTGLSTN